MNFTEANEIKHIIRSLQPKKSSGYDNLSPHLFKLLAEQISLPIAILINKSLSEGIVPDEIKMAIIIRVYKSKAKNEFSNYRPTSLLPTISKILEKVVHSRTYDFLQTNNIFNENQYGFLIIDVVNALEKIFSP